MSFLDLFRTDPRRYFTTFIPQEADWKVVSWNFDLRESETREWTVELVGPRPQLVSWRRKLEAEQISFFQGKKRVLQRSLSREKGPIRDLMNLAIHSTLKQALESRHELVLAPVSGATALDFQNEQRALQWLQASLGTLTRALDEIEKKPELILTGAFFSGTEPDTGKEVTRVLIFNLDIFLYFEPDQSLRVLVFDDKDQGHGKSQTPTFHQIIKVTKPQIYDEIVKLTHRIATVGEIR